MATRVVDGHEIELTHTDRVLFPQDGITKGELIDYYEVAAEVMLPHMRDRPLMLNRFPNGIDKPGFVQKEASEHYPDWIRRVRVEKAGGSLNEMVCENAATLVYLANQACITPHIWLSRVDELDVPDRMILDLDPWVEDFEIVRTAARSARSLLEEIGLPCFLMTTGSRGLHVSVPIEREWSFDFVREFAQQIAAELARRDPEHVTDEPRKDARKGRLYVDTFRNSYAQTAVAPYAVRAKAGTPVATPLDWEELDDPELRANRYTIRNVLERIERQGDPWKDIARQASSLERARKRVEKVISVQGR